MFKTFAAGALSCLLSVLPVQAAAETPVPSYSPAKKRELLQSLDTFSPQEKAAMRQAVAAQGKPLVRAKMSQYPDSKYLLDDVDFRAESHDLVYVFHFKPQYADSLSARAARPFTVLQTMVCELEQHNAWLSLLGKMDVRNIVFRLQAGGKRQERRLPVKDLAAQCGTR